MPEWAVRIHPGFQEVEPLDWEERFNHKNRRLMWNRGFWLLSIGIPLAIGGFILSGAIAMYAGQMVAHLVTPIGITLTCSGGLLMELAEWYIVITIGFGVLAFYAVFSYIFRKKGINKDHVHLFFRGKESPDEERNTDISE
jgi:hypothetical protein